MSDSEYLSITQAAERLSVNPKTLRRWINAGKIAATKEIGPRGEEWRIHAQSLPQSGDSIQKPHRAAPAPPPLSEDIQAMRAAQDAILTEMRERMGSMARHIESLEAELHDTRAQLSQFQDQVIKALPAPQKTTFLERLFKRTR